PAAWVSAVRLRLPPARVDCSLLLGDGGSAHRAEPLRHPDVRRVRRPLGVDPRTPARIRASADAYGPDGEHAGVELCPRDGVLAVLPLRPARAARGRCARAWEREGRA